MTVVSGDLKIVTGVAQQVSEVWARAARSRPVAGGWLLENAGRALVTAGRVEIDLHPGPCVLVAVIGGQPAESVELVVPEGAKATLEACVRAAEGAGGLERDGLDELRAEIGFWFEGARESAAAAKVSETAAGASATKAKASESNAKTSETNAKASELSAKQQADRAEGAIRTTRWVGDQVEINGQLSPHLTGKAVVNAPLETRVDVADVVAQNRSGLVPDHPYSDPTPEQVAAVKGVVSAFMRGKTAVAPEGMEILEGFEGAAQRNVRILRSVPGNGLYWGVWVFPIDDKITGVMEAPHPVFDGGSDDIAVRIWAKSPAGTVLAVAGSHRTNPDGLNARDVAHNTKSMWHQITTFIAQPGLPELQLHGFGDDSMPGVGAVVSSGSSPLSAGVIRTEAFISAAGIATARQWDGSATKLIGMANIQGDAAAVRGNPFMHIELSKTVRDNPEAFIEAAASAGFLAGENGALLTNEFPKPVGSANSRGESATAARADHTHRLVQNDPQDGEIVAREGGGWRSIPASQVVTSGGGYVKPSAGIPSTDLAQDLKDMKATVDAATYSATANTLMKRTSTGAVSVADPTASVHAANKKYVDGVAATKADASHTHTISQVDGLESRLSGVEQAMPKIQVVTALPMSPDPSTIYLVEES
ncbi:hypothetical protein [Corynebacterium auriscanis]|uniref:hypothetical protein n=1 Tax=Corynebacterium auriscanis TaxID=99807 RepID=UPI0006925480|nr:hypothetical protein [Corynebacterium auriscanis]WJY73213.1 hypothetical protein CAURIC_08000 [Corynebacterium auriscanis]